MVLGRLPTRIFVFLASLFAVFVFITALMAAFSPSSLAGPYVEGGTSLGSIKSGDKFFNQTGASSTGTCFIGSMSLYYTTPTIFEVSHFDFGIQNRLSLGTGTGQRLAMLTPNLAIRFEFWRFFVGGGASPYPLTGTAGPSSLKGGSGRYSYFMETGAIWRVIPELQIVAAVGLERGKISGASSPKNLEYGLRFRFPLFPSDEAKSKGVKWDGFRYPFGVMRD